MDQPERISYTNRDLLGLHDEVTEYIAEYIPAIEDASEMNNGRVYLTIMEALADNNNFATDQIHNETIISEARQRKNIIRRARALGYSPSPVSAASVDLTFSMLVGTAPVGGYAVPIYTRMQTTSSPTLEFLTTESGTIAEGATSVSIPAVQGILVSGESLATSSSGELNQEYTLSNAQTPHQFVEISVDSTLWTRVDTFASSDQDSNHYILQFDEDDFTTVIFGNGTFGKVPSGGSVITATYIYTNAEDGNVVPGSITRLLGTAASNIGVTNALRASGGAASESNDSIRQNAPAVKQSDERAVTPSDHVALAQAEGGVFRAFADDRNDGARTDVFLLPEGGGEASSFLISQVQTKLDAAKIDGSIIVVDTLKQTGVIISVNVVTKDNKTPKATVRQRVRQATLDNLDYRLLTKGRAFTRSDLSGVYEALSNRNLVDYVDFPILTRVPRVEKSNSSAPDFVGRIDVFDGVEYSEYLITATSTTEFSVSVDSAPQSTIGTVATEFTTDDGFVKFTLGETGDTLTVGNTWKFSTSRYSDNIVIGSNEVMFLERESDLEISVFFPGEYDIATKSAVA